VTSPPDDARPFRILGIQQIAMGGLDRAPLRHLWCDLLGLTMTGSYQSATENVIEDILSVGKPPIEIDLMQPIDLARSPRVHEPPLNHIGLWVDDLRAAVTWLQARGVRFTPGGIRRGAAGHDVCFIHPKPSADEPESGQGVLIELVQAPLEVIQSLS
jgi:lactoylglutathione lyase